jgi:hypothetical protein
VCQEVADVKADNVRQTPTFFVNGQPLVDFGPQQLADLVRSKVERVGKGWTTAASEIATGIFSISLAL